MTVGVYDNCYTCWNGCPSYSGDKCGRVVLYPADTNGARFIRLTRIADVNVVTARSEISTGMRAQCHIVVPVTVTKRIKADSHILIAKKIELERTTAGGSVVAAVCVAY